MSFKNNPKLSNVCTSFVGRQEGTQEINLSNGCYSHLIILHQFLHSIGFYHEQSRPDRDNYVKVNQNCIPYGRNHNFKIHNTSLTFGLPYDAKSVMHYTSTDFSNSKKCKTITSDRVAQAIAAMSGKLATDNILPIEDIGHNIFTKYSILEMSFQKQKS